jgi:DNA-binding CsgD family transcriptional regulator
MAPTFADDGYRRQYIVRPCAVAGTPFDYVVAIAAVLMLLAILVLEVITPDDVVSGVALLPLVGAMWTLSTRLARIVMGAGLLLFAVALGVDHANRSTLLLIAFPVLVTTRFVRLWATSLARPRRDDMPQKRIAFPMHAGPHQRARGPFQLTSRELEVARLAARAYTAAEIGQALHIGERTVESHIASTYGKLGIRSRPELIRMASRLN